MKLRVRYVMMAPSSDGINNKSNTILTKMFKVSKDFIEVLKKENSFDLPYSKGTIKDIKYIAAGEIVEVTAAEPIVWLTEQEKRIPILIRQKWVLIQKGVS